MRHTSDTPATFDLFADDQPKITGNEQIGPQSFVLRGFALPLIETLLPALRKVVRQAPFRHLVTPGGFTMSAAMTCCGSVGWTSSRQGYRYSPLDPQTGRPWPRIPEDLMALARSAAEAAGFPGFIADACLINRYVPGAKMSLHQDKDEADHHWPVVSISLGIAAIFEFGGFERSDKPRRVSLFHGDVVVWGGVDRLRFHGVQPIKQASHPLLGEQRINLTLRKAL
jgi:alkylated DNA repair protein (DNA oxidative demethylase)